MTIRYPRTVQHRRARNGTYPGASFYNSAIYAENHITTFRKREVFRWNGWMGNVTGSAGTINHSRFYFHAGYGTTKLVAYAILGRPTTTGASPYVTITAKIPSSTTFTFAPDMNTSATSASANDYPEQWTFHRSEIEITPNTTYEGLVTASDYARILSMTIFEEGGGQIDDAVDYYNEQVPQSGSKVLDAHRERLLPGLSNMWKRNGGLQVNWGREAGATRTRTLASVVNLIDNTTTGNPTANSPGWTLDLAYRTTVSRAVVPCKLAVYASMSAGSGAVFVTDTADNSPIGVTVNSATPQWFTATGNLVAAAGKKYDPEFNSDGVGTLTVHALSLFEFET